MAKSKAAKPTKSNPAKLSKRAEQLELEKREIREAMELARENNQKSDIHYWIPYITEQLTKALEPYSKDGRSAALPPNLLPGRPAGKTQLEWKHVQYARDAIISLRRITGLLQRIESKMVSRFVDGNLVVAKATGETAYYAENAARDARDLAMSALSLGNVLGQMHYVLSEEDIETGRKRKHGDKQSAKNRSLTFDEVAIRKKEWQADADELAKQFPNKTYTAISKIIGRKHKRSGKWVRSFVSDPTKRK